MPHHLVLTVEPDVPALHRRTIREIFAVAIRQTTRKYPDVSFSLGCLMPDHAHLVAQPGRERSMISRAMQHLAAGLARAINRAYGRQGRVFRDRFFSRALRTASELLGVLHYIGMNPVKAGYVKRPEDWVASGVRPFLGGYLEKSPWRFWGWAYRVLGFEEDPGQALRDILSGKRRRRTGTGGRQLRLPLLGGRRLKP